MVNKPVFEPLLTFLKSRIPEYHLYSRMLKEASLAVVVCGDNKVQTTDFWAQDCSAATENMLIVPFIAASFTWGGASKSGYPPESLINFLEEN